LTKDYPLSPVMTKEGVADTYATLSSVMAGLVPAIHAFLRRPKQGVDARHKAGHDSGLDLRPITER
jgi:hypothetical protein